MENASKALIFAASVLISIVIISMLVLVYNSLTSYQQTSTQTQREAQINEFNKQFEGYNRANVRGNELYSLISKVIDYNITQSDIGENDENYEPMTVSFTLENNKQLTRDGINRIFTQKNYTYDNSNLSDSLRQKTIGTINTLNSFEITYWSNNTDLKEKGIRFYYSDDSLNRLVTGYDKIFVDDYETRNVYDKAQVFYNFNSALGADFFVIPTNNKGQIDETKLDNLWKNVLNKDVLPVKLVVLTYYEYVQFKRGIFECIPNSVAYSNTGRIIKMEFRFTGKFD